MLCAHTALNALCFVDYRLLVLVKRDSAFLAGVLTAVSYTASAGVGDFIAADGALITGNADTLDNIRVILVAAHCKLDALLNDSSLFIHAAAHCRLGAGDNRFGNIVDCFKQITLKRLAGNLTEHLVFQILNLCVKFSHYGIRSFR